MSKTPDCEISFASRSAEFRVVHTALFWETLSSYRNNGHYDAIRTKLQAIVQHRATFGTPHPREALFTSGPLRGIWHFHIMRKPNVILFHSFADGILSLHMFGDHDDFAYRGVNRKADQRTRNRIDHGSHNDVSTPLWPTRLRWTTPNDLLRHPDLPEMSPEALEEIQDTVEDEFQSLGRRWSLTNGRLLESEPPAVVDAYIEELITLSAAIEDIQTQQMGAHYDRLTSWARVEPNRGMP